MEINNDSAGLDLAEGAFNIQDFLDKLNEKPN